MFLKRLKLKSYRNYEKFDFEFSKNKTLFVGKNAQGKTNLLRSEERRVGKECRL